MSPTKTYWWRLPDDEDALMSLRPAELKCYLVVVRAIQRDRHQGKLSIRQIAERANLNPKHVHSAIAILVDLGMLARDGKPGTTAVYQLPFQWRNRTPTGEQLNWHPEAEGEQQCMPVGEQNCTPTGEQHLELLEFSESGGEKFDEAIDLEEAQETSQLPPSTRKDDDQQAASPAVDTLHPRIAPRGSSERESTPRQWNVCGDPELNVAIAAAAKKMRMLAIPRRISHDELIRRFY
jgi:hypothetical protein